MILNSIIGIPVLIPTITVIGMIWFVSGTRYALYSIGFFFLMNAQEVFQTSVQLPQMIKTIPLVTLGIMSHYVPITKSSQTLLLSTVHFPIWINFIAPFILLFGILEASLVSRFMARKILKKRIDRFRFV